MALGGGGAGLVIVGPLLAQDGAVGVVDGDQPAAGVAGADVPVLEGGAALGVIGMADPGGRVLGGGEMADIEIAGLGLVIGVGDGLGLRGAGGDDAGVAIGAGSA